MEGQGTGEDKEITNLKPPHQKGHKGSVDAALEDEDDVGESGRLCDHQILFCREFKLLVTRANSK